MWDDLSNLETVLGFSQKKTHLYGLQRMAWKEKICENNLLTLEENGQNTDLRPTVTQNKHLL